MQTLSDYVIINQILNYIVLNQKVLKTIISMRWFFWAPKTYVETDQRRMTLVSSASGLTDKKILTILAQNFVNCMGESFQDYYWIQDFEADFPQNAELGRF